MRVRILAGFVLALTVVATASGRQASTFEFRATGYANNVRVAPPLVAKYQLGVARFQASGTVSSTRFDGTIKVTSNPMLSRYADRWLKAKVGTWAYNEVVYPHGGGTARTLTLTVEITASSNPSEECAPGVTGKLVLTDTPKTLSNGKFGDAITLGHWSGTCNTFVMGWSNEDGGIRTDPSFGGPGGGQRADVSIDKS